MKTSLGIWAFGAMATRFNPGGYKPELAGVSTASKVATAVAGLGDLIDDYEFHYPQELSPDESRRVRDGARRARHLLRRERPAPRSPLRQGRLLVADDATRAEALRLTRRRSTSPQRSGRT